MAGVRKNISEFSFPVKQKKWVRKLECWMYYERKWKMLLCTRG